MLLLPLPLLHRRGIGLRRLALQVLGFAFQILGVPQQRLPIALPAGKGCIPIVDNFAFQTET